MVLPVDDYIRQVGLEAGALITSHFSAAMGVVDEAAR